MLAFLSNISWQLLSSVLLGHFRNFSFCGGGNSWSAMAKNDYEMVAALVAYDKEGHGGQK